MNPKVAWPLSIVLALGVGIALDRVLLRRDRPAAARLAPGLRGRYVLRRDDALATAYAEAHEIVFGGLGIDRDQVLPLQFDFRADGVFHWTTPLDYDLKTGRLAEVEARRELRSEGTGRWASLDDGRFVLRFDATMLEADPEHRDASRGMVVVSATPTGFDLIRAIGQGNGPTRHSYDLQR